MPRTPRPSSAGAGDRYAYDADGNTTERPDGSTTQQLDRNSEGKLSRLTEDPDGAARATDYIYGADGSLLIRRDTSAGGETVLYLGATEVHLKGGKTWANRYYTHGGETVALCTNQSGTAKTSYLTGDQHGTGTVAITSDDQALTKRYLSPFGAERGDTTANWPDDKAFLDNPTDTTTGLTHVGAREYDAAIGQFISVDPLLQTDIPQTLNRYGYAAQKPVTQADTSDSAWPAASGSASPARPAPTAPPATAAPTRPSSRCTPARA
ncbi:RHS repeat-associated core domain-containing protein [Streptomyces sp. NPDC085937]|uniref:RHS repeat-associated core domain-containing protein n=1 Tax=Streptomyces sp. NPDC085937 TaxID=3365742 RepID=UPI0037D4FECA